MLLIIFFSIKDISNKATQWFKYGVLAGLAFHVHPTAVLAGYFVAVKWLENDRKIRNVVAMTLGIVLTFLPLLINEFKGNPNLVKGTLDYIRYQSTSIEALDFLKIIFGLWITGPYVMLKPLMNEYLAMFLVGVQALLQFLAFAAPLLLWKNIDERILKLLIHLWVFFILSCIGLIIIRANTPWYMTYGVSLTAAMITAIGLH